MVSSSVNNNSFKNQVIPTECIPLWLGLAIVLPLTVKTIASIQTPIIAWIDSFMSNINPELLETKIFLPSIPLSIIVFSLIGFVICLCLFVIVQTKYINNWYIKADRKGLYKPPMLAHSVFSLISWNIYRFFYILMPVIVMSIVSFTLMFLSIKYFNLIAGIMGHNLEIVLILSIFTALTTAFFWVVAVAFTAWNTLSSVYGSVIAVTEPGISNTVVRRRSRRFAFLTASSWVGYIVYLILMAVVFLEFLYVLINPSFISIGNSFKILVIELLNIGIFVVLGRSLTFSYHKSLLIQYAKIAVKKSRIVSNQNNAANEDRSNYTSSIM